MLRTLVRWCDMFATLSGCERLTPACPNGLQNEHSEPTWERGTSSARLAAAQPAGPYRSEVGVRALRARLVFAGQRPGLL